MEDISGGVVFSPGNAKLQKSREEIVQESMMTRYKNLMQSGTAYKVLNVPENIFSKTAAIYAKKDLKLDEKQAVLAICIALSENYDNNTDSLHNMVRSGMQFISSKKETVELSVIDEVCYVIYRYMKFLKLNKVI